MRRIRNHITSAHVLALVALFVAMGGVGYAAIKLPKNSVGTRQIKKNAVNSSKVKNHSLKKVDFKNGELPAGARGPAGPAGATGPAGPITGSLPSHVTLRGQYAIRLSNPTAGQRIQTAFSWGFSLPSPPTAHYIPAGGAVPPECAGGTVANPQAQPGQLCVFEQFADNITAGTQTTFNSTGTDGVADPYGAGVAATATAGAPTDTRLRGSWAVTAP